MKTEEDEAFDELARKQGDWGGGFPAKRKMAADKLGQLLADNNMPDTSTARAVYRKMIEDDDDIQDYKRPWVGLTDDEIEQGNKESWVTKQAFESAVWWAEAKLKEKNSG
jgi:hypothetical protein